MRTVRDGEKLQLLKNWNNENQRILSSGSGAQNAAALRGMRMLMPHKSKLSAAAAAAEEKLHHLCSALLFCYVHIGIWEKKERNNQHSVTSIFYLLALSLTMHMHTLACLSLLMLKERFIGELSWFEEYLPSIL